MTRREALKSTFFSALLVAMAGLPSVLSSGEQKPTGITIKMDTALLRQGDVIMNADSERFVIVKKDGKWQAVGMRTHLVIDIEHVIEESENELMVPTVNDHLVKPYVLFGSTFAEADEKSYDGRNVSWQKADEVGQYSHYEDDGGIKLIQI